jgi:hypothetical protein
MNKSRADLILHPERFRILSYFADMKRTYTAHQLAMLLPAMAPATLYRHLNRLVEGGILRVVEERAVGNRTLRERYYGLVDATIDFDPSDGEQASLEDLLRYMTVFLSTVLQRFHEYAEHQDQPELYLEQGSLHLTDQEYHQVLEALQVVLQPWSKQEPGPGRKSRLFSLLIFPEKEEPSE